MQSALAEAYWLPGGGGGGAMEFVTRELLTIGKAQSPSSSHHATFTPCFCIVLSLPTVLCDQL